MRMGRSTPNALSPFSGVQGSSLTTEEKGCWGKICLLFPTTDATWPTPLSPASTLPLHDGLYPRSVSQINPSYLELLLSELVISFLSFKSRRQAPWLKSMKVFLHEYIISMNFPTFSVKFQIKLLRKMLVSLGSCMCSVHITQPYILNK